MKKIAIFLFEGAELFEIASFTDIFGWNNIVGLKEFRDIKVETISYKEEIKSTWGGVLKAEKLAKENNIEIVDTIVQRDYCAIDSIRYYDNLILQKSNELAKKVKANPYISNDSIIKYREYGITLPKEGKANSTAYYGIVKGTTKVVGIYVMDDGRIISFDTEKNEYMRLHCSRLNYIDFVDSLIY